MALEPKQLISQDFILCSAISTAGTYASCNCNAMRASRSKPHSWQRRPPLLLLPPLTEISYSFPHTLWAVARPAVCTVQCKSYHTGGQWPSSLLERLWPVALSNHLYERTQCTAVASLCFYVVQPCAFGRCLRDAKRLGCCASCW